MFGIKWPWDRRADKAEAERRVAEKRSKDAELDWEAIRKHKTAIDSEVRLNDWTSTAVTIFQGKKV